MADEEPNIDLSDGEQNTRFPWLIVLGIVVVVAILAVWLMRVKGRQDAVTGALQKEVTQERAILDAEREKVFDMTKELEALKQQIALGTAPDHQKAVAQYNKLAAEQRAQREKVKSLADPYNEKVEKLHDLQ